jgi:hypothetical protein
MMGKQPTTFSQLETAFELKLLRQAVCQRPSQGRGARRASAKALF